MLLVTQMADSRGSVITNTILIGDLHGRYFKV